MPGGGGGQEWFSPTRFRGSMANTCIWDCWSPELQDSKFLLLWPALFVVLCYSIPVKPVQRVTAKFRQFPMDRSCAIREEKWWRLILDFVQVDCLTGQGQLSRKLLEVDSQMLWGLEKSSEWSPMEDRHWELLMKDFCDEGLPETRECSRRGKVCSEPQHSHIRACYESAFLPFPLADLLCLDPGDVTDSQ